MTERLGGREPFRRRGSPTVPPPPKPVARPSPSQHFRRRGTTTETAFPPCGEMPFVVQERARRHPKRGKGRAPSKRAHPARTVRPGRFGPPLRPAPNRAASPSKVRQKLGSGLRLSRFLRTLGGKGVPALPAGRRLQTGGTRCKAFSDSPSSWRWRGFSGNGGG